MSFGVLCLLAALMWPPSAVPAAHAGEPPDAAVSLRFELPGEGAAAYDSEAPATPLDRELAAELAQRFPGLRFSSRLARAAEAFAAVVDPPQSGHLPVPFAEAVLHWSGSPDLSPKVTFVYTTEDSTIDLWTELGRVLHSDPPTETSEIGIGRVRGDGRPYSWRWAGVVAERKLDLEPFPRSVPVGEAPVLSFRLAKGLADPEVVITSSRDRVSRRAAARNGDGYTADVQLGLDPGSQWIEVIAVGRQGPEVAAVFPVWVGEAPPHVWEGPGPRDESWIHEPVQAEEVLVDLINDERHRHGLPLLVPDPRLAAVARAHSLDMAARGYFAHVSPEGAGLPDRLRVAGIHCRRSAENLSRSPSVAEAHSSLMRSPGHAANILSSEMDRVGVGVAFERDPAGRPVILVTEVFAGSL